MLVHRVFHAKICSRSHVVILHLDEDFECYELRNDALDRRLILNVHQIRDLAQNVRHDDQEAERERQYRVPELIVVKYHELAHLYAVPDGGRKAEVADEGHEEEGHVVAELVRADAHVRVEAFVLPQEYTQPRLHRQQEQRLNKVVRLVARQQLILLLKLRAHRVEGAGEEVDVHCFQHPLVDVVLVELVLDFVIHFQK